MRTSVITLVQAKHLAPDRSLGRVAVHRAERHSFHMADEVLRQKLADAVQASRNDVRHPWYALCPNDSCVPDDYVAEIVTTALRRWRSSERRKGGQRDRVHDVGKGLWDHFKVEFDYRGRDDFIFLGAVLAEVMQEAD